MPATILPETAQSVRIQQDKGWQGQGEAALLSFLVPEGQTFLDGCDPSQTWQLVLQKVEQLKGVSLYVHCNYF